MTNSDPLPRLVALVGNPSAGKTTAAEILRDVLAYEITDDGLPLRKIAMEHLGLTEKQVFTQEGKLEKVTLNGREWTVREILGEIGNAFEEKFGGDIIPIMSQNNQKQYRTYVMGSCRREQPTYWKSQGAVVIEIVNPDASPSQYEFDSFNPSCTDIVIINDGLARGLSKQDAHDDLSGKLVHALLGFTAAGAA